MTGHQRLRIGLIGAGSWAIQSHLEILDRRHDEVELWAVCRRNPVALDEIRRRHGFRYAFSDYRELAQSGIDVCIVTSPGTLHFEHASAALQEGVHTLVEKPFTTSAKDAWALVTLARDRGVHLLGAFGFNYLPIMTAAIDLLDASGGLGDLEFLDIHMGSAVRGLLAGLPADRTSGRHQGWQPETYHNPRLSGGGYAQSQLTHALGMGLWLAHARASRVFAITSPSATEIERHDAFVVRYATGAIGTISGTSTFRGGGPHRHQLEIRALGTGGELSLDLEMNRLSFTDPSGHRVRPRLEPQASRYRGLGPTDLIVDLALGRTGDNRSPGELGARTVELIEAAYASRRTGQPESIDAETEAAV